VPGINISAFVKDKTKCIEIKHFRIVNAARVHTFDFSKCDGAARR